MKTDSSYKPAAKPLKIHKSCDPTWVRWSVSVPGVTDTQWFKTPQAAAKFAAERGYVAIEEQASSLITINKAEHDALVAVAKSHAQLLESLERYEHSNAFVDWASMRDDVHFAKEAQANLELVRKQSPTTS